MSGVGFGLLDPCAVRGVVQNGTVLGRLGAVSNDGGRVCSCRGYGVHHSSLLRNVECCSVTVTGFVNGSLVSHMGSTRVAAVRRLHGTLHPSVPINSNR